MSGQLKNLMGELAEVVTEKEIEKAENESNRIKGALDKLAASQPAKKIKKSTAANRKDVTEMRELLRKRRMQENSQVKITKDYLRTIIKEEISSINEQDDEKSVVQEMIQNLESVKDGAMNLKSLGAVRMGLVGTINGLTKILQALGEGRVDVAHRVSKGTLRPFSSFVKGLERISKKEK